MAMGTMTPAFNTARLAVFQATVVPSTASGERIVYIGFLLSGGAPQTIAHAVVWDLREAQVPGNDIYCDWLQVASNHAGAGYGRELFEGIENHLRVRMGAIGVTEEGKAMLRKMGRPENSIAPVIDGYIRAFESLEQQAAAGHAECLTAVRALLQLLRDPSRPPHEKLHSAGQFAAQFNGDV
jgi:GNAT superfamily N-acetyltransferase